MVNLAAHNESIAPCLQHSVERVLKSGQFVGGHEVAEFELSAAHFLNVKYAIGVSSGSDALVCALLSLGIGIGDEVITTGFSFFATVEAILRVGARPVFVDLAPGCFEATYESIEAAIGPRTRAILAVHLYGFACRVDRLRELAARRGISLVEDAAQAFGAQLQGEHLGTFGALGCFSFMPSKPLGACGDAGLVVTKDPELAMRCRALRLHGATGKHHHESVGGNYRMDEIQAAVLAEKLKLLPCWLSARKERALSYNDGLATVRQLTLPQCPDDVQPSHALYTIRVADGLRDPLASFLARHSIETAVHYPTPLYRQPALTQGKQSVPSKVLVHTEEACCSVLSLPLYPELTRNELTYVVETVKQFPPFTRALSRQTS